MTAAAMPDQRTARGRLPAALGIASVSLLAVAFLWAHHWGAVADTIVAAWAGALLGLALAGVSIAALVITGIAMAAGADPAAGCGGG